MDDIEKARIAKRRKFLASLGLLAAAGAAKAAPTWQTLGGGCGSAVGGGGVWVQLPAEAGLDGSWRKVELGGPPPAPSSPSGLGFVLGGITSKATERFNYPRGDSSASVPVATIDVLDFSAGTSAPAGYSLGTFYSKTGSANAVANTTHAYLNDRRFTFASQTVGSQILCPLLYNQAAGGMFESQFNGYYYTGWSANGLSIEALSFSTDTMFTVGWHTYTPTKAPRANLSDKYRGLYNAFSLMNAIDFANNTVSTTTASVANPVGACESPSGGYLVFNTGEVLKCNVTDATLTPVCYDMELDCNFAPTGSFGAHPAVVESGAHGFFCGGGNATTNGIYLNIVASNKIRAIDYGTDSSFVATAVLSTSRYASVGANPVDKTQAVFTNADNSPVNANGYTSDILFVGRSETAAGLSSTLIGNILLGVNETTGATSQENFALSSTRLPAGAANWIDRSYVPGIQPISLSCTLSRILLPSKTVSQASKSLAVTQANVTNSANAGFWLNTNVGSADLSYNVGLGKLAFSTETGSNSLWSLTDWLGSSALRNQQYALGIDGLNGVLTYLDFNTETMGVYSARTMLYSKNHELDSNICGVASASDFGCWAENDYFRNNTNGNQLYWRQLNFATMSVTDMGASSTGNYSLHARLGTSSDGARGVGPQSLLNFTTMTLDVGSGQYAIASISEIYKNSYPAHRELNLGPGTAYTNKGYLAGGSTGGTTRADGMNFNTHAWFSTGYTLNIARIEAHGLSSKSKGYFAGGLVGSTPMASIDAMRFADESASSPMASLSVGRHGGVGLSCLVPGYHRGLVFGGYNGSTKVDEVDGLDFTTETAINPSSRLMRGGRSGLAGVKSGLRGYVAGGADSSGLVTTELEGILFTTETSIDYSIALSLARSGGVGISSQTEGFFAGGIDNGGISVNEIDGLSFSTETALNPTASLGTSRHAAGGLNSTANGYIAGGGTNASSSPSSVTEQFSFSSKTIVALSAMPSGRPWAAGVQQEYPGVFVNTKATDYRTNNLMKNSTRYFGLGLVVGGYYASGVTGLIQGHEFSSRAVVEWSDSLTTAVARACGMNFPAISPGRTCAVYGGVDGAGAVKGIRNQILLASQTVVATVLADARYDCTPIFSISGAAAAYGKKSGGVAATPVIVSGSSGGSNPSYASMTAAIEDAINVFAGQSFAGGFFTFNMIENMATGVIVEHRSNGSQAAVSASFPDLRTNMGVGHLSTGGGMGGGSSSYNGECSYVAGGYVSPSAIKEIVKFTRPNSSNATPTKTLLGITLVEDVYGAAANVNGRAISEGAIVSWTGGTPTHGGKVEELAASTETMSVAALSLTLAVSFAAPTHPIGSATLAG